MSWIQVPFRVMFNLWSVLDLLLCAKTFIEDSRQMTISCQPLTFVKHVHATSSDLSLFFHLACPQSHTHNDLCPLSAQSQPCWSPLIIALAVFISMQSHPFWFPGIGALAMSISPMHVHCLASVTCAPHHSTVFPVLPHSIWLCSQQPTPTPVEYLPWIQILRSSLLRIIHRY